MSKILLVISFLLLFIASYFSIIANQLLLICSLLITVRLLYKFWNTPVFFLFLFLLLFHFPFIFNYLLDWEITNFSFFNNTKIIFYVGRIFFLFQFVIFYFINEKIVYTPVRDRIKVEPNQSLFYLLLIISILLYFTTLSGESLLTASYGSQEKHGSALYEYVVALILLAFTFSSKNKFQVYILSTFMVFYVSKDLLFGGRVSSLQMILLAYIIFIDRTIKFKIIIFYAILFIIFLKAFEFIRLYNGIIIGTDSFDIKTLYSLSGDIKVYGSNEGNVVYSSIRLLGLVKSGIISFYDRIYSLLFFLFSSINPGFKLPSISDLSSYLQDTYPCGGGGLFPIYFFVWGGLFGVAISGFFIGKVINWFMNSKNIFLIIYSIMILCTFPRWFAYNPIIVIKLSLFPIYFYFFIKLFKIKTHNNSL
jgi:hypothetical protein